MSLPHVLLGMLNEPASGYDLKRMFGQSVRHFWFAELSQIYPALAKLEKDDLLESQNIASDKGPNRKLYKRTSKGSRALRDWIVDGPVCRTERIAYLTQVFFLETVSRTQQLQFFEELRADFAARLKELQLIEKQWSENDPRYPDELPDRELFRQMTLRSGLLKYQMTVDWCDECLQRIRRRSEE